MLLYIVVKGVSDGEPWIGMQILCQTENSQMTLVTVVLIFQLHISHKVLNPWPTLQPFVGYRRIGLSAHG